MAEFEEAFAYVKQQCESDAQYDQTVVQPRPLTPIEQLRYVDRVIAFKPGGEAEQGANKRADPKAALGDVRPKQLDEFVALGAFGALTVGIEGQLILAKGDDDLTLFVHPVENMHPYLVEALPTDTLPTIPRLTWMSLGASPGVTQSFSARFARAERRQRRGGRPFERLWSTRPRRRQFPLLRRPAGWERVILQSGRHRGSYAGLRYQLLF